MPTSDALAPLRLFCRLVFGSGAGLCGLALAAPPSEIPVGSPLGIGQHASASQIASWDIDIAPDGRNLPPGSGSVAQGLEIYRSQCAGCHGADGKGGVGERLVGGQGTLATANPIKTVGSYWPYATTLFDYIRRAMPMNAPQSLSADQVYAVSAYVLYLNGLVPQDAVLSAATLPEIRMPNRDGFSGDPRPDVVDQACMSACGK